MTFSPKFIRHVNVEKCPKCRAVLAYLQKESEIGQIAWRRRN